MPVLNANGAKFDAMEGSPADNVWGVVLRSRATMTSTGRE
jgi:hypothetical protein